MIRVKQSHFSQLMFMFSSCFTRSRIARAGHRVKNYRTTIYIEEKAKVVFAWIFSWALRNDAEPESESKSPIFLQFLCTAVHVMISFVASFSLLFSLSLSRRVFQALGMQIKRTRKLWGENETWTQLPYTEIGLASYLIPSQQCPRSQSKKKNIEEKSVLRFLLEFV